ncbi:MAG: S8 family serine peptidase, partial [Pseudomonas sp.]
LHKDGKVVARAESTTPGETISFDGQPCGMYKATFQLSLPDGTTLKGESVKINTSSRALPFPTVPAIDPAPPKSLKGGHRFYNNVKSYFLEVKFQPGGLATLNKENAQSLSLYNRLKNTLTFKPVFSAELIKQKQLEEFADFYRIDGVIAHHELIPLANELETLDYVIYCSVTPDTRHMSAPKLPVAPLNETQVKPLPATEDPITPDFRPLQRYVDKPRGMNIRSIWSTHTGKGSTVRLLDFGVYANHEDLQNVQVVTNVPETEDCNHGTASSGCIVATDNSFGVKGIAHDCQFFFYDVGDLDLIVRDASLGDIVALNVQFESDDGYIPIIDSKSWWDKIHALTRRDVTVVVAAGNSGLDLSKGYISDFGDSGGTLVGCCYSSTGDRHAYSNYGHYTSWFNSWGENVTTTGYSSLQDRGINASYSNSYSGTSSATPLCAAAMAVIQGYAMLEMERYYPPLVFREAARYYGYDEGAEGGIGYRPNVADWLEDLIKQQ